MTSIDLSLYILVAFILFLFIVVTYYCIRNITVESKLYHANNLIKALQEESDVANAVIANYQEQFNALLDTLEQNEINKQSRQ